MLRILPPVGDPVRARLFAIRCLAMFAMACLMLRLAWISDDSLVTLRTALNFTHGWGAGFNAGENVQAYTHPLWFLIWSVTGTLTNHWILGILILSVAFSTAAAGFILWSARSGILVLMAAALLICSNAFMEYSTSGLENPLSYFFLGAVFVLSKSGWDPGRQFTTKWSALMGLTLAATALTRLDLLLILCLPLTALAWRMRRNLRSLAIAGAAFLAPLVLWGAWSWLTYSSLVPNTLAAKRNVQIPLTELLNQGFAYLLFSVRWDLGTAVALGIGVGMTLLWGGGRERLWLAGLGLYVAYVVSNGGDFMAGRFLAVPVYISVALTVSATRGNVNSKNPPVPQDNDSSGRAKYAVASSLGIAVITSVLLVVLGRIPTSITIPAGERWSYLDTDHSRGIADERGVWVGWAKRSVFDLATAIPVPLATATTLKDANVTAPLAQLEFRAANWPRNEGAGKRPLAAGVAGAVIGTLGVELGPAFHVVDTAGLADRFLAEQAYKADGYNWRIGHFLRAVPDGYLQAVRTGSPAFVRDVGERYRLVELWRKIRKQ